MTFTGEDVAARLEDVGVRLDRPLTEADVRRLEKRYGFTFGPDHRALLRVALPVGDTWVNWRHASPDNLRARLARPVGHLRAQVRDGFWATGWGPRPADPEKALTERLGRAPALLPLYGDCYLAAAPAPAGGPVLSVQAGGVAVRGKDLLHYVDAEFSGGDPGRAGSLASSGRPPQQPDRPDPDVDFWQDLATAG